MNKLRATYCQYDVHFRNRCRVNWNNRFYAAIDYSLKRQHGRERLNRIYVSHCCLDEHRARFSY